MNWSELECLRRNLIKRILDTFSPPAPKSKNIQIKAPHFLSLSNNSSKCLLNCKIVYYFTDTLKIARLVRFCGVALMTLLLRFAFTTFPELALVLVFSYIILSSIDLSASPNSRLILMRSGAGKCFQPMIVIHL